MAYPLMPVLGTIDILLGLSILFSPTRIVLTWLVLWGIITASLRPLSGEAFAELIERAGNFGVPLTLLILSGLGENTKDWFTRIIPDIEVKPETWKIVFNCLRVVVFLLLAGHGWLNLIEKKGLVGQYKSLGFSDPAGVCKIVGLFEIMAACLVLVKPWRPLLLVFLVWKMGTELFYPHWELFEWVERGGSYGAILALWFALPAVSLASKKNLARNFLRILA